ncbi:MAG: phage holin [Clostridia bacterium]|nr:phage holin [Clostridia bacterium]
MKWKNRFTNYNFWISIVSAVLLIFQAFNIKFDLDCISEIVTAVLGLLVVIGIILIVKSIAVRKDFFFYRFFCIIF